MRVVLFCHSLVSDWNHGNAHFLRGVVARAARARPRRARLRAARRLEPRRTSSPSTGARPLDDVRARASRAAQRGSTTSRRSTSTRALDGADLVLVHEWNDPALVARDRRARARAAAFRLLFHDTHHRAVTAPRRAWRATTCADYDGVLAFGARDRATSTSSAAGRRARGPGTRRPTRASSARCRRERATATSSGSATGATASARAELHEFLLEPVRALGLRGLGHGVRYPTTARARARARRRSRYARLARRTTACPRSSRGTA